MLHQNKLIVLILLTVIFILSFVPKVKMSKKLTFIEKTKSFVINLEKNSNRLVSFMKFYSVSDLSAIDITRFNAINGKEIDVSKYVTESAHNQILNAESNGYRMRHYELTRGAIGCFLSHVSLYNRLLTDDKKAFYLIFEDDARVPSWCINAIDVYTNNAPKDWDILLFGVLRKVITAKNSVYDKVKAWWGLFGYIINKQGAQKIVSYLNANNKIDKQIDSLLSLMIIEGKLNVYSTREKIIDHNMEKNVTDIQLPIKVANGINPFQYEDVIL